MDINIFVEPDDLTNVLSALNSLGIEVDLEEAAGNAAKEGIFIARFGLYRLDFFTPSIPFAWEAERSRTPQILDGHELLFGDQLDAAYVREQIVGMLGEDDPRLDTWDRIQREAGYSS